MSVSINPDIITDGLVLCLDAANPDCFRGESTTNLITGSFVDGFGYSTVISSNEIDQYGVVRSLRKATINNISGWNRVLVSSSIGIPVLNRDYTISMWIKRVGDISVTAGWEPEVGSGDGYLRPNIESGYIGTAGASPQPNTVPTEWTYITYSFKYTATTTTNLLLLFYINGNNGAQILFSDPQVETKSYATPYVNGTRGGTVATGGGLFDLSNNNNHGTIVRNAFPTASFYNSSNRGRLIFDGTNDYITLNKTISDFGITSNATLSFWANITLLNRWTGLLGFSSISGFGSTAANFSLDLNPDNNIRIWKNNTAIFGGSIISNNTWNLYSITSFSGGFAFYFNSSLINSATTAGNITSTNSLIIGDNWDNSLQGSVSSVMLYNKTLSLLEIQQNYKVTKGRFGL